MKTKGSSSFTKISLESLTNLIGAEKTNIVEISRRFLAAAQYQKNLQIPVEPTVQHDKKQKATVK